MSNATVIHGDAIEEMSRLADHSIDAVLCDPPYGTTQCPWDAIIPLTDMWAQLNRVCRPGAAVVLTACMPFSASLLMSNPKRFRHHWVWEKNKATGHLNSKRAPMRAHEDILVFCDRAPAYVPQMTTGHARKVATRNRGKDPTPVYGYQAFVEQRYDSTVRYPRTVQRFDILNNDDPAKVHPTQKPVGMLSYFLRTYTRPGDIVLDFACGSGSTGEACLNEGRRFIGIEKDLAYIEHSRLRLGLNGASQECAA